MIKVAHLVKKYDNGFTENVIFDDFDITIEDGEFVAIHGRSGCGKGTLLNMIGLIVYPPAFLDRAPIGTLLNMIGLIDKMTAGTYILDGRDISELKPGEYATIRNRDIGFIFQAFHLLQDESVLYNVELPMKYAGVDKVGRKEKAVSLLDIVGLAGKEKCKALQLSGGEMQRVAIARALASSPKYILADEPTGSLDIENRDKIMELLKSINKEQGSTIIMVTHDRELLKYASRVISL